jgi:hypothetical protein
VTDYRIDLIGSDGHFESSRTSSATLTRTLSCGQSRWWASSPRSSGAGRGWWNDCPLLPKNRPSAMKFMKVDWCQRVRRSTSRLWACLVRTSAISLTSSHGNWIRRSRRSLPFLFVNLRLGLKPKFQVAVGPRATRRRKARAIWLTTTKIEMSATGTNRT